MKNIPVPQNIFLKEGHVEPIRFYVREGESYIGLFDLQIKTELKDLDDLIKQQHSLSIYLKPPVNAQYKLKSIDYDVTSRGNNVYDYKLIPVSSDVDMYNPYISWHGSGQVHATAHQLINEKWVKRRIVTKKDAISWRDVKMGYSLVLRAIIPVSAAPPQALELDPDETLDMIKQKIPTKPIKNIILDNSNLVRQTVVVDIFIHNRGFNLTDTGQLPYPNNSELMWLAPPLKFENNASVFLPAVSLFAYQPAGLEGEFEDKPALILEGITLNHPIDEIYVSAQYS